MKKIFTFKVVSAIAIILFLIVVLDILFFEHKFNNNLSSVFSRQFSTAILAIDTSTSTVGTVATSSASTTQDVLPPEDPTNYSDNNNGTITDNYTKLVWLKCPLGFSGSTCDNGSPALQEWSKSRNACESLTFAGKTGWRLPTLKEAESIVNTGAFDPAINTKFFLATVDPYWTASAPARYQYSKFTVLFSDGSVYFQSDNSPAATRCVRDNN